MLTFERTDCPTVMSGLVVRYKLRTEGNLDGEITASREGVTVQGTWPEMAAIEDIRRFERMLRLAHLHYLNLYHQYYRLALHPMQVRALSEEEVDRRLAGEAAPDA